MKNLLSLITVLFAAALSVNAQTLFWDTETKSEVLLGTLESTRVNERGSIKVSPSVSPGVSTGEQYIWSAAAAPNGDLFVGTGGNGKLFRVSGSAKPQLILDTEELNVSALAADSDGVVFAATAPDGKIYRIDKTGQSKVLFDPKTKYIWSLTISGGSLFAGTGENGRVYKINKTSGLGEIYFDSDETHIISLAADTKGNVYAGSDSSGIVYKITAKDNAFAVLDSSLREIHELSIGKDGSVYALALSESVSATDNTASEAKTAEKTIKIRRPDPSTPPTPPTPSKSRYDLSEAKSVVYRILPDGIYNVLWNSKKNGRLFDIGKSDRKWGSTWDRKAGASL